MSNNLTIQPMLAEPTPGEVLIPNQAQAVGLVVEKAFRKERKRLLSFIRKRVPEAEDAEDILQDVFYQLLEHFDVLKPIEQVTAWLFRVARNKIIDQYRKRRPELLDDQVVSANESEDGPVRQVLDWMFDPNDNPETQYARSLVWDELTEALEELPVEQREAFVMHELEGKSFKEMADIAGVSVNTMLSRKRYAVLHLRDRLLTVYKDLFKP